MALPSLAPRALIERPKTFQEMQDRPAFQITLDQGKHELAAVLSDYSFPSMIACGLSKCRTLHNRGYLVETVDGLETNVGHRCGRNNFGEAFDIARTSYVKQRDRADLLAQASRIKAEAPLLLQRISEMNRRRFGIKWVKTVRSSVQSILSDDLFQSLCTAAKRGDLLVTEARERTDAEIENIIARTRQQREQVRVETVDLGALAPMPWLNYDFGSKLRDELMVPLQDFIGLDLELLATPKLRAAVKKFDGATERLDEAGRALDTAQGFFSKANLELLVRWVPDRLAKRRRAVSEWASSKPCRDLLQGLAIE